MATFRVGVGSFNIQDGAVGFGTDTDGLGNLKVKGVTKTTDIKVSGASTLTRYSGFAADNINQLENITLTSEVGTIGDIVVGVGTSVIISSGSTVTVGTVESVSIGTHFSPPVGGIEERGDNFIEGMMRFNIDLNTMEFYNGIEWRQFTYISDIQNSPGTSGRGIWGNGESTENYHFIQIPTKGNSVEFGTYTVNNYAGMGAFSDGSRAIFAGGVSSNVMEYLTIQSKGDAIDFGDMTSQRDSGGACSSSTRGVISAGINRSPLSHTNVMDYVEIQTIGNALDFGDLVHSGGYNGDGFSSPVRGFYAGGGYPTGTTDINVITISTKGNSTKFGDQSTSASYQGQASNNVRGIIAGGIRYSPYRNNHLIEYVTMASEGNTTEFGELTLGRHSPKAVCTHTRVCFGGGYTQSPFVGQNIIDFIQIASLGDAKDFGDISTNAPAGKYFAFHTGTSDSHGGLGGY